MSTDRPRLLVSVLVLAVAFAVAPQGGQAGKTSVRRVSERSTAARPGRVSPDAARIRPAKPRSPLLRGRKARRLEVYRTRLKKHLTRLHHATRLLGEARKSLRYAEDELHGARFSPRDMNPYDRDALRHEQRRVARAEWREDVHHRRAERARRAIERITGEKLSVPELDGE